jgi:hypothetical protein
MTKRSERGSASSLVLVLVVLVGAVGWNYHRNAQVEEHEFRPYRSYTEADLAALIEAYEEVEAATGDRYESAVTRRSEARGTGDLMGNLNEFERVQRAGRKTRDARGQYADARASLEELRKERARRAGERSKLRLFLRRAFTF